MHYSSSTCADSNSPREEACSRHFFNCRCIKRMDMALTFLACRKEGLGPHSERAQEFFKEKSVSLTKAYSATSFFNVVTYSKRKKKLCSQLRLFWKHRKTKIKRRQKDIAKVPHITEASSSASLKGLLFCKGFFLKQTGWHGLVVF